MTRRFTLSALHVLRAGLFALGEPARAQDRSINLKISLYVPPMHPPSLVERGAMTQPNE
jgi:hypothetical protein